MLLILLVAFIFQGANVGIFFEIKKGIQGNSYKQNMLSLFETKL